MEGAISNNSLPMATLYIGDLHPNGTEAVLHEKFSAIGPILSIRVCRDRSTRRSLGYAYVNFQNYEDAARALETMNYDLIYGKPIRIMWYQRDATLRKSGIGNVFIKNLEKHITNREIYNTFSIFGNILSCKVVTDERGISKGYGFVHFDTEEAANEAISKLNGIVFNGKKVYVGNFIPRIQRENCLDRYKFNFTNIYIKNFEEDLDDEKLKKLFEKYGNITSAKAMTDEFGKLRGFGFVNFENSEDAQQAIEEMNGKELNGKILYVGWARGKSGRANYVHQIIKESDARYKNFKYYQGLNVFIKNLDNTIDDQNLAREFLPFGTITSAKVMTDANGNSKGFGFVCFSTPEEANRAIANMNGKFLISKPLYVTLAKKKDDRRAEIASRYLERIPEIAMQPHYYPIYQLGSPEYCISPMFSMDNSCFPMYTNSAFY
ncbi:polyadenylate-binding protein 4-like [Centruroides vittatus]|uniref:polyadenylate-binding protein 4-like n=1 Tax=Centruroides vittatus TaxID=120091 RepID=UPI00350EC2F7